MVETQLLELCPRATNLANGISAHLVEYLTTSKNQQHGMRELALTFSDVCQTLWPIQAGLMDASTNKGQLPVEVTQELGKKFQQTIHDFSAVDLLLSKLLIYEKKTGFSKFSKGLNLMFADSDIQRLRESLAKDRDALRMGSLAFKWILGDTKAGETMGNAYTSLAAVLHPTKVGGSRANTPREQPSSREAMRLASPPPIARQAESASPKLPPLPPTVPYRTDSNPSGSFAQPISLFPFPPSSAKPVERAPSTSFSARHRDSDSEAPPTQLALRSPMSVASSRPSKRTTTSTMQELAQMAGESPPFDLLPDDASQTTVESMTHFEEMLRDVEHARAPHRTTRLKVDTKTVPRWTPKRSSDNTSPTLHAALVAAVQQKNHKILEELLDGGISPESVTEVSLLGEAVMNQDVASVRLLLLFGADANRVDTDGSTPLLLATESGFLEAAKLLLKYGGDPNLCAGSEMESPLAMSVVGNRFEHLQQYLKYGGDANTVMSSGSTPFVKAIHKTVSADLVELMLTFGAKPNGKTRDGKTPLLEALLIRRVDLVTLLLDHGANPNLPGPKHPLWPSVPTPKALQLLITRGANCKLCPGIMELAASTNSIEAVSILLRAQVDPNIKKDGVYTPLCSAIRDDRVEMVNLLLSNGANPNLQASEFPAFKCITHGRVHILPRLVAAGADLGSPKGIIEVAVAHNNMDALMYLLRQGVSPNDKSAEGYTPLTTAIRDGRDEMVDILLAHGANPSIRGQDWPLCMAVKKPALLQKLLPVIPNARHAKGVVEMAVVANELESIKLLLQAGISVEDKNGGVFSPLTTAIRERRTEIVRYLLDEAGADVNAPGEHLPIVKAIRRCRGRHDMDIIEMLLVRGANINLVYRGWNAIMQAVENGDTDILKLLLTKGNKVDLAAADDSGNAVIDIARERGWEEGVDLLLANA